MSKQHYKCPAISCNLVRLPVEGLEHQPSHKPLTYNFPTYRCAALKMLQKLRKHSINACLV